MTVAEIYRAELELFGVTDPAQASGGVTARCLTDINAAIQQMQDAGEDFYGREPMTVDLVDGVGAYVLDKDVQSVLDPATLSDDTILRKLTSRGQLLTFAQLFQDQLTGPADAGKPVAYYVESLFDDSDPEDNVTIKVHVRPAPDGPNAMLNLILGVIKDARVLTAAGLVDNTARIPVPHKYVESILLPLVRWNATTSYFFVQKEMLDRYEADYERALKLLGKADPRKESKPNESNTAALESAQPARRAA